MFPVSNMTILGAARDSAEAAAPDNIRAWGDRDSRAQPRSDSPVGALTNAALK